MPPNTTAQIAIQANPDQLPSGLGRALQMITGFAGMAKNALSNLHLAPKAGQKAGWGTHAMGTAVGNLATRGVDKLVELGSGFMDFNDKLVRFGIAANQTPMQLNAISRAARETSTATGIDANVVLDSARAYVDLAGAQNFSISKMKILARAGQASEAQGKDLAGMMYQLTRSMKVADNQMEDTIGGLINQAKEGAIEAKQMSAEFAGMMPIFARFGVVGREGAVQLGAMYQVTRDGFDSASQAATGMIRLMAGFQRHASRFEQFGVHIFKPGSKKDLREVSDIMEQVKKSPLNKDIEALIKAFGRSEAWRTFELLAAAPERLKELEQAGRANGVVQKDLMTYAESANGRLAISFEKMKNAAAAAFTPERIDKFASAIEGVAQHIGPLVELVGKFGDLLGGIYSIGKTIRGFSQADAVGKLAPTTMQSAQNYADVNHVSQSQAFAELQEINNKALAAQAAITNAIKDDKTTPESNKAAVRASLEPATMAPIDAHSIGEQYIKNAGLTDDQVDAIKKQIQKETVDADIRAGRGRSVKEYDIGGEMLKAINAGAPAIGRSVANAMNGAPPPAIELDGQAVNKSVKNDTNRRRRP
jgi:TP901 family phage tail tape measure protein